MENKNLKTTICTVIGRSSPIEYILVENDEKTQYIITQKRFNGDMSSIEKDDKLEVIYQCDNPDLHRIIEAKKLD